MLIEKFNKEQVIIRDQIKKQYVETLRNMKQSSVHHLFLLRTKTRTVIKEITHINFMYLTILQLWKNNVQSIEGLSFIQTPHLEDLNISYNNMISVRAVRKSQWPKLARLDISENYVSDQKNLAQGHFPLRQLFIYDIDEEDKNRFIEPCSVFKLQTPLLQSYCTYPSNISWLRNNHCIKKAQQRRWKLK